MRTAQPQALRTGSTESDPAVLSPALLDELRTGYQMDSADLARHNAVINNSVKQLALNRGVARGDDGHFSHRVRSKGILDQKRSGRCWIFAGLNVLRPEVMRRHRIETLEFSTAYLQFWDKMEKSNLYLESILELRDADYLDRDWEMVNTVSIEDGGWWNYLAQLLDKYGILPLAAMPETHASSNTETLNEILDRLLKARAVKLLDLHQDGADLARLRAEKNKVLAEVYRLMVIHFGEPPTEFDWRFEECVVNEASPPDPAASTTPLNARLTAVERHTPLSFYEQYVGQQLSEFVCLYNDPHNRINHHYCFDRARNMAGGSCMNFVNIDAAEMKAIAKVSILANEPLWFAVNMKLDQSTELGLMKDRLFDYESLFGIDLRISKANRTRFHSGASGHAMALVGLDLDACGAPRKWLVENSWGDDKGNKGLWTLHDDWFDEHVYTIIVHRRFVPGKLLDLFNDEPDVLPAWYPGARGIRLA